MAASRSKVLFLIGVAFLVLANENQIFAAPLCRTVLMHLFYKTQGMGERLLNPNLAYTGYRSEKFGSTEWTPELVSQVANKVGIYAPVVRQYASAAGISLTKAAETLKYIQSAPPDLINFLLVSYQWEGLGERSPFISTSNSKSAAARFGPYPFSFWNDAGSSVIFSIDTSKVSIVSEKEYGWSESWDVVQDVMQASSRNDLLKLEEKKRDRALSVWDWLEIHAWFKELTLNYSRYKDHPEEFARDLSANAHTRFSRINSIFKPAMSDLWINRVLERERIVFLYVPPTAIVKAKFFNKEGSPVKELP